MKKLLLLFLSIIPLCFWAQEKIYIDGVGNPTTKEKAKFYLKVAKENGYDIGTVFERYIRN